MTPVFFLDDNALQIGSAVKETICFSRSQFFLFRHVSKCVYRKRVAKKKKEKKKKKKKKEMADLLPMTVNPDTFNLIILSVDHSGAVYLLQYISC